MNVVRVLFSVVKDRKFYGESSKNAILSSYMHISLIYIPQPTISIPSGFFVSDPSGIRISASDATATDKCDGVFPCLLPYSGGRLVLSASVESAAAASGLRFLLSLWLHLRYSVSA